MSTANWMRAVDQIANELRAMSYDQSISLTIDELIERIGADEDRATYRERSSWAANQRGIGGWNGIRRAGLVVNFCPDETGRPVERVTFRIDRFNDHP